jgi:hypothetical protein
MEPIDYANSENNVAGFADSRSAVSGLLISGTRFHIRGKFFLIAKIPAHGPFQSDAH